MRPESPWFRREGLALLTDYYQLTMLAGYWKHGRMEQRTSFNYFFRALPPHSGFAITAGLGPFLDYLDALRFEASDLDYLRSLGKFEPDFLEHLARFRLTLDVSAVPEGTAVFPHEPIVQIEGPIFQTQLVETVLLNFLNYQTLIATKAARICLAAAGEPVMEFGLRRAHGPDGGVSGSRAAYIGGCTASSNMLSGKVYGIPLSGTHAHSWVMSFEREIDAFRAFVEYQPERPVLLVDTYDTLQSGVPNAIQVYKEMHARGQMARPAIRLDSGDLAKLSKEAWRMMTAAGFDDPLIVATNDLDEDLIADLKRQGAKINGWGVGTHLITAGDSPSLSGVYKLSAAAAPEGPWVPRVKVSGNPDKSTDPGCKQLRRYYDEAGAPIGDVIGLAEEELPGEGPVVGCSRAYTSRKAGLGRAARSEALLRPVMKAGRRLVEPQSVHAVRDYAQAQVAVLPEEFKRLRNPEIYRVLLSTQLGQLKEAMTGDALEDMAGL
jgi:nicotinate phosphoribosyltransferase